MLEDKESAVHLSKGIFVPYQIQDLDDLTKWVELIDLPDQLPIGLVEQDSSQFNPNTEYIPNILTGQHEIILGDLEDRYEQNTSQKNYYKIFSQFFSSVVTAIGNHKTGLDRLISQMYMSDALAIFLNFRIAGYGEHISLSTTCICSKQKKIADEEECHDILSLRIRMWQGDEPPIFQYELKNPIGDRKYVLLEPPKFCDVFDEGFIASDLQYETKLAIFLSDLDQETYENLDRNDRNNLIYCAQEINSIGLENSIPMFCNFCDREWDAPLYLDRNNPAFYLDLISPPRLNPTGTVREYLNQQVLFLTVGDQAPFNSPSEVFKLTPKDRQFYIGKLHEIYEEQKRSMKKK